MCILPENSDSITFLEILAFLNLEIPFSSNLHNILHHYMVETAVFNLE